MLKSFKKSQKSVMAAVLCFLFCLSGCGSDAAGDAAASAEAASETEQVQVSAAEEVAASDAEAEASGEDDWTALTGSSTVLCVPQKYTDEISIDIPYEYYYYSEEKAQADGLADENGNPYYPYIFQDAIYMFADKTQAGYDSFSWMNASETANGRDGLVWIISTKSLDELDQILADDAETCNLSLEISTHILGTDAESLYCLTTMKPRNTYVSSDGETGEDSLHYDPNNEESRASYLQHAEDGLSILQRFISENSLKPLDGAVDWEVWYQENFVNEI